MRSVIRDSVVLPCPADELYQTYLDQERHSRLTGTPVTINGEPGSAFTAFNGSITGTTLATIPPRLIVQSWRSSQFGDQDPDSTVILAFIPEDDKNGRIELIQFDVPQADYQGVVQGWPKFYWEPWKTFLGERVAW